jgi:hypothetical protein
VNIGEEIENSAKKSIVCRMEQQTSRRNNHWYFIIRNKKQ